MPPPMDDKIWLQVLNIPPTPKHQEIKTPNKG